MTHYLLTGAGFSRNWGCWLGNEVFEFLLGTPEVKADNELRDLLWKHKEKEGFEGALGELQEICLTSADQNIQQRYINFLNALGSMFKEMNLSLAKQQFEFDNNVLNSIPRFLSRFDGIFTLNQDLLLENFYANAVSLASRNAGRIWNGLELPGVMARANASRPGPNDDVYDTKDPPFALTRGSQPYFKLHGSSNWKDHHSKRLMVMGVQKHRVIGAYPLLNWYREQFIARLSETGARLMIIGYSFRDAHINNIISEATERGLKLFIIDPAGTDAIKQGDPMRGSTIPGRPWDIGEKINKGMIGASRRSLATIFKSDEIERSKILKFFAQP